MFGDHIFFTNKGYLSVHPVYENPDYIEEPQRFVGNIIVQAEHQDHEEEKEGPLMEGS